MSFVCKKVIVEFNTGLYQATRNHAAVMEMYVIIRSSMNHRQFNLLKIL